MDHVFKQVISKLFILLIWLRRIGLFLLLTAVTGFLIAYMTQPIDFHTDWRKADRSSAHLAPASKSFKPAVVQVYAARAYHWRGLFAVHTWIAVKPENASHYTVYQVLGWKLFQGFSAVDESTDVPDRIWFNHRPTLLKDIRGKKASELIPKIQQAVKDYPYSKYYQLWPGPNSNTFTAYVARKVPELQLDLPPIAIGQDYLGDRFFSRTTAGTGYQFSWDGIFGILFSRTEGLELNFLGLTWGIHFSPFSLALPGIGKISAR